MVCISYPGNFWILGYIFQGLGFLEYWSFSFKAWDSLNIHWDFSFKAWDSLKFGIFLLRPGIPWILGLFFQGLGFLAWVNIGIVLSRPGIPCMSEYWDCSFKAWDSLNIGICLSVPGIPWILGFFFQGLGFLEYWGLYFKAWDSLNLRLFFSSPGIPWILGLFFQGLGLLEYWDQLFFKGLGFLEYWGYSFKAWDSLNFVIFLSRPRLPWIWGFFFQGLGIPWIWGFFFQGLGIPWILGFFFQGLGFLEYWDHCSFKAWGSLKNGVFFSKEPGKILEFWVISWFLDIIFQSYY